MIEKLKGEIEYLNNGFEYDDIKKFIELNGSGVYEFVFGCRGGLEDFVKNDEYLSLEEVKESFYDEDIDDEYVEEFYGEYELNKDFDFMFCISYFEEGYSVFVNVVV